MAENQHTTDDGDIIEGKGATRHEFAEAFAAIARPGGRARTRRIGLFAAAAILVVAAVSVGLGAALSSKGGQRPQAGDAGHGGGPAAVTHSASAAVPASTGAPGSGQGATSGSGASAAGGVEGGAGAGGGSGAGAGTGSGTTGGGGQSAGGAGPTQGGTTPPSGPVEVTGQIKCVSGDSVEGVYVQAAQGSAFANWKGLGDGAASDYWLDLPTAESYSVHVGCGGTTSNWGVPTYGPTVSGTHNSFSCVDVKSDAGYGTCEST